jgi:hypothetical protein
MVRFTGLCALNSFLGNTHPCSGTLAITLRVSGEESGKWKRQSGRGILLGFFGAPELSEAESALAQQSCRIRGGGGRREGGRAELGPNLQPEPETPPLNLPKKAGLVPSAHHMFLTSRLISSNPDHSHSSTLPPPSHSLLPTHRRKRRKRRKPRSEVGRGWGLN